MDFYECYRCTEVFFIEKEFEDHLKDHDLPIEFKCQHEKCEKSFKRLSELRKHQVNIEHDKRDMS